MCTWDVCSSRHWPSARVQSDSCGWSPISKLTIYLPWVDWEEPGTLFLDYTSSFSSLQRMTDQQKRRKCAGFVFCQPEIRLWVDRRLPGSGSGSSLPPHAWSNVSWAASWREAPLPSLPEPLATPHTWSQTHTGQLPKDGTVDPGGKPWPHFSNIPKLLHQAFQLQPPSSSKKPAGLLHGGAGTG